MSKSLQLNSEVQYLIDVNLPKLFNLWNTKEYIHQFDIDPKMKDGAIWKLAKSNELTIITKDSDFSTRIIAERPPPKVIHIRIGNCSMTEFFGILNEHWEEVIEVSRSNKLVTLFKDRIEYLE
jgi:predicted nuclease of predicted toxin-antitoxin system